MKNAGKARSYGLYRHLRTSKEIIENLLNYLHELFFMQKAHAALLRVHVLFSQVFDPPFRLLRRQRRKPDINGRARFLCVSVGHAVGLPEGELDA